jgi:hypothetical protein
MNSFSTVTMGLIFAAVAATSVALIDNGSFNQFRDDNKQLTTVEYRKLSTLTIANFTNEPAADYVFKFSNTPPAKVKSIQPLAILQASDNENKITFTFGMEKHPAGVELSAAANEVGDRLRDRVAKLADPRYSWLSTTSISEVDAGWLVTVVVQKK